MTTLQWFLLVLALVVAIVVVAVIFGPNTGSDTVPTGAAISANPDQMTFVQG